MGYQPPAYSGLEDRLRGLILTSSGNVDSASFPPLPTNNPTLQPQDSRPWEQSLHTQLSPPRQGFRPLANDAFTPPPSTIPTSPKGARKRPNQAQRRQMSAQLSIPVDPRPVPPPAPQSARPYAGPPAYHSPHHRYHHSSGGVPQAGHPQSSPFHNSQTTNHWRQTSYQSQYNGSSYSEPPGFQPPRFPHAQPGSQYAGHSNHGSQNSHHGQRRPHQVSSTDLAAQSAFLDALCHAAVASVSIRRDEIAQKEAFREKIERICQEVISRYESDQNGISDFPADSVSLRCFGSLASGFAVAASDMDLGLLSPISQTQPDAPGSPIPRMLEKALLDQGFGARLLSRTRVPIIKLCEAPPKKLYLDLLAEHEKWERGVQDIEEHAEGDDQEHGEMANENEADDEAQVDAGTKSSAGHLQEPNWQSRVASLKQSSKSSLPTYYNLAKRVLRRVGGREITTVTFWDLTAEEFVSLNLVCRAYVQGLYDKALRSRLEQHCSISELASYMDSNRRSLLGLSLQVDGEKLLMDWEKRGISDRTQSLREEAKAAVTHWTQVQNKPNFGIDPLAFTKELQLAHSKLVALPSIRLGTLEQLQHETPFFYHLRAAKMLADLEGSDVNDAESINRAVIEQYVAGISQETIRQPVLEFAASLLPPNLNTVARRHKSLHLALEYEKAIEKDLYLAHEASLIKQYIQLLRQPMRKSLSGDKYYDYVVGMTAETMALVNNVKGFSDPGKLAPNQRRDPYHDRLEFPKTGAGVQCDINFSAHLALENTALLRCYSHTDPRVRPLVLFVKNWAKARGINSGYRGTLSSYGYVLMMLHYLVNVANPFVCPNLQLLAPSREHGPVLCKGRDVSFWRDEAEIIRLAQSRQLNNNQESIGSLLRGFFEYYAQTGMMSTGTQRGFEWGREVLSLRTSGGLVTKHSKGWTGAKTILQVQHEPDSSQLANQTATVTATVDDMPEEATDGGSLPPSQSSDTLVAASAPKVNPALKTSGMKEIRHRYLLAIEDPFETDHNVARTVTHHGIVSIRDEFRRAWRIIRSASSSPPLEDLLENSTGTKELEGSPFQKLFEEIHGLELFT